MSYEPMSPIDLAHAWSLWCGENKWTRSMRSLANVGCTVVWWGGYPRSASAIPLCFVIYLPNGKKFNGHSRLKDIIAAKAAAEQEENTGKPSPNAPKPGASMRSSRTSGIGTGKSSESIQ